MNENLKRLTLTDKVLLGMCLGIIFISGIKRASYLEKSKPKIEYAEMLGNSGLGMEEKFYRNGDGTYTFIEIDGKPAREYFNE